jgi:hypothetical protein
LRLRSGEAPNCAYGPGEAPQNDEDGPKAASLEPPPPVFPLGGNLSRDAQRGVALEGESARRPDRPIRLPALFYLLPCEHWTKRRWTNPLERVNKEIGRRSDVIGNFPNDSAVIRLAGALLSEQNDCHEGGPAAPAVLSSPRRRLGAVRTAS